MFRADFRTNFVFIFHVSPGNTLGVLFLSSFECTLCIIMNYDLLYCIVDCFNVFYLTHYTCPRTTVEHLPSWLNLHMSHVTLNSI